MGKGLKIGLITTGVVVVVGLVAAVVFNKNRLASQNNSSTPSVTVATHGKDPWGENCHIKNNGRAELTVSPLQLKDIEVVSPMGLTAGGHVTPIDHMYFYPVPTPGDRFSAQVLAAADGVITSIQHRGNLTDGPPTAPPSSDEFRLTIEQTCNQGYYYDLVTKLAPDIKAKVGNLQGGGSSGTDITIKAGQLIGYVGNQSLDFGVYDTTVTLGFIVPDHYKGEPWKIHTADAFSYFQKDVLATILPKASRLAESRSGKIDYDKDGYLIGNWFEQGTNGYAGKSGQQGEGYWKGHLAILYDAYDPRLIIISLGSYNNGDPQAFAVKDNKPDPATINQGSGLVKYELTSWNYYLPDGSSWDRQTPAVGLEGRPGPGSSSQTSTGNGSGGQTGTILFQLTGPRLLKVEVFPNKTTDEVTGFTTQAKTYER